MSKPLSDFSNSDLAVLYYFQEKELLLCEEFPDAPDCQTPEEIQADLLAIRSEFAKRGLLPTLH